MSEYEYKKYVTFTAYDVHGNDITTEFLDDITNVQAVLKQRAPN